LLLLAFFPDANLLAAEPTSSHSNLETVIITESRVPEPLIDVTRSVEVIEGTALRNSGASNLADYLSRFGFQRRSDRGANYGDETITIRGLSTSTFGTDVNTDILVLIDGRRSGSDSLSFINPDTIDRLEVIRGPGGVQYGSAAMGGVINVITIQGGRQPHLRLEAGFGSSGNQRYSMTGSGQAGSLDLAAGASFARAGDYRDGRSQKYPHSGLGGRTDYLLRAGWNFGGSHRLGLTFQGARLNDMGGLVGSSASSLMSYVQYQDKSMDSHELLYEGGAGRFSWLARYFGGQTGYTLNRHPDLAGRPEPSYVGAQTTNDFKGGQGQLAFSGESLSAVAGFDWLRYDFSQHQAATFSSPLTVGESLYRNAGFYLLSKLRLLEGENLVISAGLRRDIYRIKVDNFKGPFRTTPATHTASEKQFAKLLPSVGLAWSPVDELKFRLNYAWSYKVPSPRQLAGNYYMGSTLFLGDLDIKPEESRNWDFGVDLNLNRFSASAGYFHTDYRNLISFQRITNSPAVSQYLNVEQATIEGAELKLAAELGRENGFPDSLTPYLNLTHLFRYQSHDGKLLPDVSRHNLGLGLALAHSPWGLSLSVDGNYIGPIDVAGSYANQTASERTGGVMLWDLTVIKDINSNLSGAGSLKLKLSLKNAFNRYYDTSDGDYMPGRTFFISLILEK
jgi:vitamin B12 transporter